VFSRVEGDGDSGYFGSAIASSISRKQLSQLFCPQEEATSVETVQPYQPFSLVFSVSGDTDILTRPGLIHSVSVPLRYQYLSFYYTLYRSDSRESFFKYTPKPFVLQRN